MNGDVNSRVFVVCGRHRSIDELKNVFNVCGTIQAAHLAVDRSNKSRGFAFIQFASETSAKEAIQRFDQTKLPDGHVLKVSFAREKQPHLPPPASSSASASPCSSLTAASPRASQNHKGKLKRHQMSSSSAEELAHGTKSPPFETTAYVDHSQVPGKRHRSSWNPASSTVSSTSSSSSSSLPFVPKRIDPTQLHSGAAPPTPASGSRAGARQSNLTHRLVVTPTGSSNAFAMGKNNRRLAAPTTRRSVPMPMPIATPFPMPRSRKMPVPSKPTSEAPSQDTDPLLEIRQLLDDGVTAIEQIDRQQKQQGSNAEDLDPDALMKVYRTKRRQHMTLDTTSEDMLTTRIDSVSLMENTGASCRSEGRRIPLPPPTATVRRESTSLLEFGARKRSYDANDQEFAKRNHGPSHRLRTFVHASGPERDDNTDNANSKKKHCTKQLSRSSSLSSQRDQSQDPCTHSGGFKVFVASTLKFTLQELEAMFSVYGDFESIELVRSFGKIKTMAYVTYHSMATAQAVIGSFEEENPEFIKVSLADNGMESTCLELKSALSISSQDENESYQQDPPRLPLGRGRPFPLLPHQQPPPHFAHRSQMQHVMHPPLQPVEKEKPWLLLEYDKAVAPDVVSQTVAPLDGMEYVDIKMTGKGDASNESKPQSQGIAYVKFASESAAWEAARRLHQREFPLHSGKLMKAFVVADPSTVRTRNGNGWHQPNSAEDMELRTVETQFAYMMRGGEHSHLVESPYHGSRLYDGNGHDPLGPGVPPLPPAQMGRLARDPMFPPVPAPFPVPPMESFFPGFYPPNPEQCYYYGLPPSFPPSVASSVGCSPYYHNYRGSSPTTGQGHEGSVDTESIGDTSGNGMEPSQSTGERATIALPSELTDGSVVRPCVHVSCAQPLALTAVVEVFEELEGVVGFKLGGEDQHQLDDHAHIHNADEEATALITQYVVKFAHPAQAVAAAKRLDGSLCSGQHIRVVATLDETSSSRRKRQRVVDPNGRR